MRRLFVALVVLSTTAPALAQEDPYNPGFHEMAQAVSSLPPEQRKIASKGLTLALQATILARSEAVLAKCHETDELSDATPNQGVRAQDLDVQRRAACQRVAAIAAKQQAMLDETAAQP